MISAVFIMGGLGVVVGIGLAIASKVFYVYVDPKISAVDDALPGANCGGCGFPGCMPNAEAIVAGKSSPNSCVAAGPEVAEAIAAVMGVSIEAKEPDIALPGCTYGVQDADLKYVYQGLSDCRAAALLGGGMKVCNIGCLGLGSCATGCPFDAIVMGDDNLPRVDEEKCTGCGTCERICPKHIITLSSVTRRIIREYTTDDCTTPCQRACPAGIDICEYIRQIEKGDYHRSVQVIKERNPFPTVIGRICPRPCENECRRGLTDDPVAINFLKRYAADYERESGERIQPYQAPPTGRKVAVIGGGVAGLSSAFFSARLGHDTTVFEAADQLGGLLRSAIARNRLAMDILDWDIDGVLEMGVTAETGNMLGRDFSVDTLLEQGFETVLLASGGWDSRLARGTESQIEHPVPGTYLLIDLLKAKDDENVSLGSHVVIAGGGPMAVQAVERCKAFGAGNITLMYRESEDQHPISAADRETVEASGVNIVFNAGIDRLQGKGAGLTNLEYVDLPTRERHTLAARTLVIAAGRFPQLIFAKTTPEETAQETAGGPIQWEAFEPHKPPTQIDEIGWLAKGDVLSDFSGAIRAIGAGRRAAAALHNVMYDIPQDLPDIVLTPESIIQDVDAVEDVAAQTRVIMPMRSTAETTTGLELEKGFTEEMARNEAKRCLQCGLICYMRQDEQAGVQIESSVEQASA
jgi:formate dehydrogenase (NADP+) beta subunit